MRRWVITCWLTNHASLIYMISHSCFLWKTFGTDDMTGALDRYLRWKEFFLARSSLKSILGLVVFVTSHHHTTTKQTTQNMPFKRSPRFCFLHDFWPLSYIFSFPCEANPPSLAKPPLHLTTPVLNSTSWVIENIKRQFRPDPTSQTSHSVFWYLMFTINKLLVLAHQRGVGNEFDCNTTIANTIWDNFYLGS